MDSVVEHFDRYWNSGWALPIGDVVHPPHGTFGLEQARGWLTDQTPAAPPHDPLTRKQAWLTTARHGHPGVSTFYSDAPAHRRPAAAAEAPNQLAKVLTGLLEQANSEVILVSAYLIPTPEFEAAIERAETRGVQVRILTNSLRSNNHLSAHSAYRGHIHRLVSHGAELYEVHAEAADRPLYMREPVQNKRLGLHAKMLIIDEDLVYVGSCNLDPRSLQLNTEMGLVIESQALNQSLREAITMDFEPRNAWPVTMSESGRLQWHGDGVVLNNPPANSPVQRLEDWFIGLLPIDHQM